MDEYLTCKQLSDFFHYHVNTVYKIVTEMREEIPGGVIGSGRMTRVSKSRFIWFMQKRKGNT